MALFEINSLEKAELDKWLIGIHGEIDMKARQKCKVYNFDFFQGLPYEKSTNFEWALSDTNNDIERDPSTKPSIRASRNSYPDEPEDALEIPDLLINIPDFAFNRS